MQVTESTAAGGGSGTQCVKWVVVRTLWNPQVTMRLWGREAKEEGGAQKKQNPHTLGEKYKWIDRQVDKPEFAPWPAGRQGHPAPIS